MPRHPQESEIEFRRESQGEHGPNEYPQARGVVVHQYGGTIEECITKARGEFRLYEGWEVVRAEKSSA